MKEIILISTLFFFQQYFPQADTLLSKVKVNLSDQELWEHVSDQNKLITEYEYLDSLEFFEISYRSDGLVVRGFAIENNKITEMRKRSVIHWVDDLCDSTSLLILAGTQDERVPSNQAVRLSEMLHKTKINYKLKLFDTDHNFTDLKLELNEELISWFNIELE